MWRTQARAVACFAMSRRHRWWAAMAYALLAALCALVGWKACKVVEERYQRSSPSPLSSSDALAKRFIEECSRSRPKTCDPCPSPNLSPLALLGRPSLDPEELLVRARTLARAGLAKLEYFNAEPSVVFAPPADEPLNANHLLPIYKDEYGVGIRIVPRRSPSLLERGMKAGDVMVGINGRPILGNTRIDGVLGAKAVLEVIRGDELVILVVGRDNAAAKAIELPATP